MKPYILIRRDMDPGRLTPFFGIFDRIGENDIQLISGSHTWYGGSKTISYYKQYRHYTVTECDSLDEIYGLIAFEKL